MEIYPATTAKIGNPIGIDKLKATSRKQHYFLPEPNFEVPHKADHSMGKNLKQEGGFFVSR